MFGIVEHKDGCLAWVNRTACTDQIRKKTGWRMGIYSLVILDQWLRTDS